MPKHIANIRNKILAATKDILIEEGYDALAIRTVASRCNASVGTIYHYFDSKELLVANVMLEDWINFLSIIESECANSASVSDVFHSIYRNVSAFEGIYQNTWNSYMQRFPAIPVIQSRHDQLIEQISKIIRTQLIRFDYSFEEFLPVFLANTILSTISHPEYPFDSVLKIILKTIN